MNEHTWPQFGIYSNVSRADYFGLKTLNGKIVRSNSTLHSFDRDPALWRAGHERTETGAMRGGSLFDCLLTTPTEFDSQFVVSPYDDFRSGAAKSWRDEQFLTIVKQDDFNDAMDAVMAVNADPRWHEMTAGFRNFQVAMLADVAGVPFKGLIDLLPDSDGPYGDAIIDVKRFGQMDTLKDVLRNCRKYNYNHQGGLYRGMARLLGEKRNRFILFIVPSAPPYTPCVIELGEHMLANGANAIMRISERMARCEESGIWPGRFDGIKQVEQSDEMWDWTEVEEQLEEAGTINEQ